MSSTENKPASSPKPAHSPLPNPKARQAGIRILVAAVIVLLGATVYSSQVAGGSASGHRSSQQTTSDDQREEKLARWQKDLEQREQELTASQQEFQARTQQLDVRQQQLSHWESKLTAWQQQLETGMGAGTGTGTSGQQDQQGIEICAAAEQALGNQNIDDALNIVQGIRRVNLARGVVDGLFTQVDQVVSAAEGFVYFRNEPDLTDGGQALGAARQNLLATCTQQGF